MKVYLFFDYHQIANHFWRSKFELDIKIVN